MPRLRSRSIRRRKARLLLKTVLGVLVLLTVLLASQTAL